MINYWLVKQEPSSYNFEALVKERKTTWDGVHNNLSLFEFIFKNHILSYLKNVPRF